MSNSYYPINFEVGAGTTDYEKYLKTTELLGLQKTLADSVSPHELLFQVTHQASELYMKLMMQELDRILDYLKNDKIAAANRAFKLVHDSQRILIQLVDTLSENISVVEYGRVRTALGQGSGMESPGFNWLLDYPPKLWEAFTAVLKKHDVQLKQLYVDYEFHAELHVLAENLMDYDDLFHKWRTHHFDMVARTIGVDSNSLKGIPTQVLQKGVITRFFPDLLELRSALANESGLAYGGTPLE